MAGIHMPDPSTSLLSTRGAVDHAVLLQRLFTGGVPYSEWAGRVRHGANLDTQRIDNAFRSADIGIMWPLGDMARESIALNPKAQGILGRRLVPYGAADYDITAAEDGLSPKEREEAKAIANVIRAMVKSTPRIRQALLDLAFGFFDGRAALEAQYTTRGRWTWPTGLEWIVPQRLSFDDARRLIVVDRWGDYGQFRRRGPALDDVPGKFVQFKPRMFGDLQEREGLAPRYLFWLLFDRLNWRQRFLVAEAFGIPWRLIETEIAQTIGGMKMPLPQRQDGGEAGAPGDDALAMQYAVEEAQNVQRDGIWHGLPGQKLRVEWPPDSVKEFFSQGSDQILERLAFLTLHNSATSAAGEDRGPRADTIVAKSGEDGLFDLGGSMISEALQTGWINVLIELNWSPDALPLAPTFQLRTQQQRDRGKELERLKTVSAQVPIGIGTWYEVSGFRAPNEGEALVSTLQLTPTDLAAITRVDEARKKSGMDPVGGEVGQKWVIEQSAAFSAFGAAKGEQVGAQVAGGERSPADPFDDRGGRPATSRDEGSSSAAEGALRDLIESAEEDDQADAADEEADGQHLARWFAAPARKVQPSTVNGSPEVLIERGVREGARLLAAWTDAMLDAAEGNTEGAIYRNLARVAKGLDVEPFARAVERRLAYGLMLGGLDAHAEMTGDVTIEPASFSMLFAGGVPNFTTMPFAEAIKSFRERQVVGRKTFDRMTSAAKMRAFTVAGLARQAMLDAAHAELTKALTDGADLRTFRDALGQRFDSAGWTRLNPSHVENIFRTNVMSAYSDGRRAQMTQPHVLAARPYWQILGVDDARTRKTHRAAHGKVLPASDPFFDRSGPPFGFQCRCRIISRSAKDLQRLGLTPTIGAQLRGLPDPGWQADAIAEPFVAEPTDLPPAARAVVEKPRTPPPFADLPIDKVPKSPAPPEGLDAYKAHQEAQIAKLAPAEREAVYQFTNGYDWTIREIDKGHSDDEIIAGIEAHRAKNEEGRKYTDTPAEHLAKAKKARTDLYKALDRMDPVSERTVLRGLRGLDAATFDAIRVASTVDMGAVSSNTWNANVAHGFAGLHDAEEGKHGVLFALKTRSAYAIEEISEFPEERELLLKKGTRFRVTRVYRPDIAPERTVVIEAEEL